MCGERNLRFATSGYVVVVCCLVLASCTSPDEEGTLLGADVSEEVQSLAPTEGTLNVPEEPEFPCGPAEEAGDSFAMEDLSDYVTKGSQVRTWLRSDDFAVEQVGDSQVWQISFGPGSELEGDPGSIEVPDAAFTGPYFEEEAVPWITSHGGVASFGINDSGSVELLFVYQSEDLTQAPVLYVDCTSAWIRGAREIAQALGLDPARDPHAVAELLSDASGRSPTFHASPAEIAEIGSRLHDDGAAGVAWQDLSPRERFVDDAPEELRAGWRLVTLEVVVPRSWTTTDDVVLCTRAAIGWNVCSLMTIAEPKGGSYIISLEGLTADGTLELVLLNGAGDIAGEQVDIGSVEIVETNQRVVVKDPGVSPTDLLTGDAVDLVSD